MNGGEEPDGVEVPMNPANKATERQAGFQSRTPPAQDGQSVSPGLADVRQRAREKQEERFITLLHHLTIDLPRESEIPLDVPVMEIFAPLTTAPVLS